MDRHDEKQLRRIALDGLTSDNLISFNLQTKGANKEAVLRQREMEC